MFDFNESMEVEYGEGKGLKVGSVDMAKSVCCMKEMGSKIEDGSWRFVDV